MKAVLFEKCRKSLVTLFACALAVCTTGDSYAAEETSAKAAKHKPYAYLFPAALDDLTRRATEPPGPAASPPRRNRPPENKKGVCLAARRLLCGLGDRDDSCCPPQSIERNIRTTDGPSLDRGLLSCG